MSGRDAMQFVPITAVLDVDKNGELSAEEVANSATVLMTLDKNGDGKLTPDELLPQGPPPRPGMGGPGGGQGGPGGGQGQGGQGQRGRPGQGAPNGARRPK